MTQDQKDRLIILMYANIQAEFAAFRDEVNTYIMKDATEEEKNGFEERYNQKVKNLQESIFSEITKKYPDDFKDNNDAIGIISDN